MNSDNYEFSKSSAPQDPSDYTAYTDKQWNYVNDINSGVYNTSGQSLVQFDLSNIYNSGLSDVSDLYLAIPIVMVAQRKGHVRDVGGAEGPVVDRILCGHAFGGEILLGHDADDLVGSHRGAILLQDIRLEQGLRTEQGAGAHDQIVLRRVDRHGIVVEIAVEFLAIHEVHAVPAGVVIIYRHAGIEIGEEISGGIDHAVPRDALRLSFYRVIEVVDGWHNYAHKSFGRQNP